MKKRTKVTISFSIDGDLLKKVDRIAYKERLTRSAVIKAALLDYINNNSIMEG